MIQLHRDPEVNRRLWAALADPTLPKAIRPTMLCRRAGVSTSGECASAPYVIQTMSSTSSAIGTPALRALVRAGLATQYGRGAPYYLTDAGFKALAGGAP